MIRLLFASALLLMSCSGSDKPDTLDNTTDNTGGSGGGTDTQPADNEEAARLAKLRAQQDGTAEAMCERVFDCQVESARDEMTEEEFAKLNPDELQPRFMGQCESDAGRSNWSPRQITVVRGCITDVPDCAEYLECLQGAQPER